MSILKNRQDRYIMLALFVFVLALIFLITPNGYIFGSKTDWLSQHITIPEYFREQFYETGNLFPDFASSLGAGQNIYNFSYYGLFRPDILISMLLPFVSMKWIIIIYMSASAVFSVLLCYYWLRKNNFRIHISAIGSLLLALSACLLFQSHRQIMFVNFLPWLFLAYIATDRFLLRRKSGLLLFSIVMIILHSYFFSIAAILSCYIYLYFKQRLVETSVFNKKNLKLLLHYTIAVGIAIMVCAVLLLPTASALLENLRSGSGGTSFLSLFTPNFSLDGLMYQPYGAGLSIIVWICLWLQLTNKKTRIVAGLLILMFVFPIFPYILNGTLYVRSKIMIVFLPILIYFIALSLQQLKRRELKLPIWIIVPALIPIIGVGLPIYYLIDVFVTMSLLYLYLYVDNHQTLGAIVILPFIICMQTNTTELFVPNELYESIHNKEKEKIIDANLGGTAGRFEDLTNPLNTANLINHKQMNKSSSYSSVYSKDYNSFFYNLVKNPIRIKNRVAQLSSNNIFFHGLMGSELLYTNKSIPYGYKEVARARNNDVLIKSDKVLPIAYATSDTISEKTFHELDYPYNLDTIYNNGVVEQKVKNDYESKMEKVDLDTTIVNQSETLVINKIQDEYQIKAHKKSKLELDVNTLLENKILLISFDVSEIKHADNMDTVVSINKSRNKLSSKDSAYPNKNKTFYYILSSKEDVEKLNIRFSRGEYTIKNVRTFSLDYHQIENRKNELDAFDGQILSNESILKGTIKVKENGYFITSIPYQKGFKVSVDGREVKYEKVNTAFVGFPISKGNHKVEMTFEAPAKKAGMLMSGIGIVLVILLKIYEQRRY